jgi:5-formyltetrahydrofolate cyclo-ligase
MDERKRRLRSELIAARARLAPDEREARSIEIANLIARVPGYLEARTLALYAPIGTEVDVGEIARRAVARGARLAYPRVVHGDRCLSYALAEPAGLVPGPLGTLEPPPGAPGVPLAGLDFAVVPGVGFSLDGQRLGRGGGHYDATLGGMTRAVRIGVAFEAQLVPELPCEPHDAPVDALVTESRVLLFRRLAQAVPGSPA